MKDLLDIINLYDNNTSDMADDGRMGFKDNPLKNFNRNPTGQNQFSGKLLTENMDLVNAIKEDAKTMSQIEVQKKYEGQLGKKTLKKIKDKYNIEFRKSYKPPGTQKKSIPYKDRFTAAEKSAMYKKRKATETEEDRIKAKERKNMKIKFTKTIKWNPHQEHLMMIFGKI